MFFASPLWLIALLPWTGVAVWLLWGRPRRTWVPFLDLWRGPEMQKPARRGLQAPPIFLAFAMIAIFLALLATAGPKLPVRRPGSGEPVALIVDRGITMSATSDGTPRFALAARRMAEALGSVLPGDTPVDVSIVPGDATERTDVANLAKTVAEIAPTALDTREQVEQAVRDRLAAGAGLVLALTDRQLQIDDRRLIQFSPGRGVENIGIVRLAARQTPAPQVMLRLRNDSSRRSVAVKIATADREVTTTLELPSVGQERDYFIDVAALGPVVQATLDAHDDLPADDQAWLVQEGSPPRIEVHTALSPELRRMIDVYSRSRPPGQGSQTVAMVGAEADMPVDSPAVWMAAAGGTTVNSSVPPTPGLRYSEDPDRGPENPGSNNPGLRSTSDPASGILRPNAKSLLNEKSTGSGTIVAVAHPITEHVEWSTLAGDLRTAGDMPSGWTALLSVHGHPILGCHDGPARRVWVGFDPPPTWTGTVDFVVFWANVFAWAGHGEQRFTSYPLADGRADLLAQWTRQDSLKMTPLPPAGAWPGLFQADDGSLRAYNAGAPRLDAQAADTSDWRSRVAADVPAPREKVDLTPLAAVLAVGCLTASALTWKRVGSGAA